jgi:glycerophosphoryl diester phosphodiesterase
VILSSTSRPALSTRPLLLGHRGARHGAPENTLAAFDLALEHGADGFEFDVRRTRDGRSVVCHDPKFHRLAVRTHTLAQLQARSQSAEERPPSLEEVLARYSRTAFLNLEIKVRGWESDVAEALQRCRPQRGYCVSSFLPSVVRKLHALDISLPLGIICQSRWQLRRWKALPVAYVIPHYRLLSLPLVQRLQAEGKTVITWTVNKPAQMLRADAWGVDGIISDDTELLVKTMRARR